MTTVDADADATATAVDDEFDFVVNNLDSISRGGISVTSNFILSEIVSSLRRDAEALLSAGAFVDGGLRLPPSPPSSSLTDDDDGDSSNSRSRCRFRNRRRRRRGEEFVDHRIAVGGGGKGGHGGGGTTAEGGGGDMCPTTIDVRTRYCEVCGLFDDAENENFGGVGDRTSRDGLLDLMSDLREYIMIKLNVELSDSMELQYLHYPAPVGIGGDGGEGNGGNNEDDKDDGTRGGGGFYGRHFDQTGNEVGPLARKFSLLLYLNDMGWDASRDGGVLRAYVPSDDPVTRREKERSSSRVDGDDGRFRVLDIVPEGGSLVLFDSSAVEHEVLPTYRERWAVVGWFLAEEDNDVSCDDDIVPIRERGGGGRAASNRTIGGGRREARAERTPRKKREKKRHKKGTTTTY
jgi:hypothetical protein